MKQNNEGNESSNVYSAATCQLVQCACKTKVLSKAYGKKARIIQCVFCSYSASAGAEGRPSFDSYLLPGSTGKCPI